MSRIAFLLDFFSKVYKSLKVKKTTFNKFHAHCHTGTNITYNTFSQNY